MQQKNVFTADSRESFLFLILLLALLLHDSQEEELSAGTLYSV